MPVRFVLPFLILASQFPLFAAENARWPQFRGPTGQGLALDTSPPITWDAKKNIRWKTDIPGLGHSSPVIWDHQIWLTTAALDCTTGQVRWKRKRSAPYRDDPITHRAFATPLLIEFEGRPQLISPAADQLHAYNPADGEELWHVRFTGFSTVPCPAYADGRIFICTGYFGPELAAIDVNGSGDVTKTHVKWHIKKGVPDNPSPLTHEGLVYVVSDKGVATCVEASTGKQVWTRRLGGNFSASPLLAGEHLYCCNEQGETHVLKIGRKPVVVSVNKLAGFQMASPAVIQKSLYLRTDKSLYCIAE